MCIDELGWKETATGRERARKSGRERESTWASVSQDAGWLASFASEISWWSDGNGGGSGEWNETSICVVVVSGRGGAATSEQEMDLRCSVKNVRSSPSSSIFLNSYSHSRFHFHRFLPSTLYRWTDYTLCHSQIFTCKHTYMSYLSVRTNAQ